MEFPQAMYRDGAAFDWDGRMVDHRHVHSQDEYDQAIKDGWALPYDFLAAPVAEKSLLDLTAPEIAAALPSKSGEELLALYDAEKAGKTRKGVLAAIEEAIAKVSE